MERQRVYRIERDVPMKKIACLISVLLLVSFSVSAADDTAISSLNGEWCVSEVSTNDYSEVKIDADGSYHIFYMNGDVKEENVVKSDGTYLADGKKAQFSISQLGEATLLSIDDQGFSGMGMIIPDDEKAGYRFYSLEPSLLLLKDGDIYSYQGESELIDAGAKYQYFLDENYFYLIEDYSYLRGEILQFNDKMFLVKGVDDGQWLVFIRASETGDF